MTTVEIDFNAEKVAQRLCKRLQKTLMKGYDRMKKITSDVTRMR